MLYDNALLTRAYLHAWQITGDPFFKRVVAETLNFIEREMTHPNGGFYSSLDADSEHEEGKFYVWTLDEIRAVLKTDTDFFEAAYGITARGNWEGKTVLQRALDDASLAARFKLDVEAVPSKLADCHSRLLSARAKRVRPGTDDKILASWNGLMLAAMAEAARAFGESELQTQYAKLATRNAEFLLSQLRPNGKLKHSWRDGKTTDAVFLEDYAALILGLLELYQTDFNDTWFASAKELADEMIELFNDPAGGFFDTSKHGETLLLRPKDTQDNATPSGNALACEALLKLAAFTDEGKYRDLAEKSLGLVVGMAVRYPTAFARWLSAADFALGEVKQVAIVGEAGGEEVYELARVDRSAFRPNVIVANILQSEAWYQPALKKIPPGEQIVTVCALPLYHIFGFNTNMMLSMRMGGCNILIANPRDLPAVFKELKGQKFHSFPAVNTLFNAMAHHPGFGSVDWSSLVISVGGGMAVTSGTAKIWLEKTGCPIIEGYGLSETSPSATCNPVDSTAFSGNIGLPMPNTELKLLDDDGNEVPMGTPGEIAIRGPQVMAGYWQRPDETAKVMTADGFFRSGDIGTVDERGYFKIVDRKKDMILVSGFNVYPNEVEDVVSQLDGVLECAAVGMPDEKAGEVVRIVIVRSNPELTEAQVRAYCEANLTGYKRPRVVEFRTELPKSNVGKILRREIRDKP